MSWDRVLSGRGLALIYEFLRESGRGKESSEIAKEMQSEDPGAVITRAGLERSCDLCTAVLDVFVSIYGAEAGNLALRALARAGVYLGGGIAPRIGEKLVDGVFMKAFTAKGRMAPMLASFPVYVILNDLTAVLGAAQVAARKLSLSDGPC